MNDALVLYPLSLGQRTKGGQYRVLKKLEGGDRRSIGRVNEVVADVLNDPTLFEVVFYGMLSDDPIIRMRSADAVEKITARHPEYLQPYKTKLIQQVAKIDQEEVRCTCPGPFVLGPKDQGRPSTGARCPDDSPTGAERGRTGSCGRDTSRLSQRQEQDRQDIFDAGPC